MALMPTTPERFEEAQETLRAEFKLPQLDVKNAVFAADLQAPPPVLEFRGRRYTTPITSYRLGQELQQLSARIGVLQQQPESPEVAQHLLACYEDIVVLVHDNVRPRGFIRRLFWRWRNPFVVATDREVAELLGFFSQSRTRSTVRALASKKRHRNRLQLTPLTISPDSFERIRSGSE